MTETKSWKTLDAAALEGWVLEALDREPLPIEDVFDAMASAASRGERELADALAGLTADALAERRDRVGLTALWRRRLAWSDNGDAFRKACRDSLDSLFRSRSDKDRLAAAGFDDPAVDAAECLRRLAFLLALAPGDLCLDKTWGFGVVKAVDEFYGKVTVDFEGRPGHGMSFAHAASSLQPLDAEHLLARRYRDPEGMAAQVRSDSAEVVRLALRSYGPLTAPLLRERLEGVVVPEGEWKRFWDTARKELKNDPLIEIPSRRNESIRLLNEARAYDAGWFESLAEERDVETILRRVAELEDAAAGVTRDAELDRILAERLCYAAEGAEMLAPQLAVSACLAVERLGLDVGGEGAEIPWRVSGRFLDPGVFVDVVEQVPARELGPFMAWLQARDAERFEALIPAVASSVSVRVLDEVVRLAEQQDGCQAVAAVFKGTLDEIRPPATVVCWLVRHFDFAERHTVVSADDLLMRCVDVFEQDCAGLARRAQNLLREWFEDSAHLQAMMDCLTALQRARFVQRVIRADMWEGTDRRGVVARAIKLYPELAEVIEAADRKEPIAAVRPRLSSWRSYRERQQQLRHLIEVEIPENSREIGVARSYGDLRENFEYQAAKDRQRILMQRQAELEADLKAVVAGDMAGLPVDRVGLGTCVRLARDNADAMEGTDAARRITILGEWDRDAELGIVPCVSGVGQALEGCAVGDVVKVPGSVWSAGDTETETYRIVSIGPPDPDIVAWMGGT